MQTGLDWNEEPYAGSHLETLNNSCGDWVPFVLNRPMREPPGTRWQYNSGADWIPPVDFLYADILRAVQN